MKFLTESDKGRLHKYFLWEIFKHIDFGEKDIFYKTAVKRQVSTTPNC